MTIMTVFFFSFGSIFLLFLIRCKQTYKTSLWITPHNAAGGHKFMIWRNAEASPLGHFPDPEFPNIMVRYGRNYLSVAKADKQISMKIIYFWCREKYRHKMCPPSLKWIVLKLEKKKSLHGCSGRYGDQVLSSAPLQ